MWSCSRPRSVTSHPGDEFETWAQEPRERVRAHRLAVLTTDVGDGVS
jgi:hypothetical protein